MAQFNFVTPRFSLVSKIGAIVMTCSFSQLILGAKAFLFEGERLHMGEFLTSENGRFRMGFTDLGELEILDLKPKPDSKISIKNWDGKTYWEARFTPDWKIKETTFAPKCNPVPTERQCYPTAWPRPQFNAYCYGDLMHNYKVLHGMPSFKVRGGTYLTLSGPDRRSRTYPIPITRGLRITAKSILLKTGNPVEFDIWHVRCGTPNKEVFLYLENCGRAIIFNENGLYWCSCPYCDDWGEGYLPLRIDYFNFNKHPTNVDLLGIPNHQKAAASHKAGGSAASGAHVADAKALVGATAGALTEDGKSSGTHDDGDYQALAQRAKALKAEMLATTSKK